MKILNNVFRCGVRMLIAGAALHGLSQMCLADEVESAEFQTSSVTRGKQVVLVADEKAPMPIADGAAGQIPSSAPGVARVGCCTSGGCANGWGWGSNNWASCPANGSYRRSLDSYTFHDVGQAWSGAGQSIGHAVSPVVTWQPCDWCEDGGWLHSQWAEYNARNQEQCEILRAHIHGKLAYFHPMGNGGEGVPPFGCYHLVYAVNPSYSDPRDSQLYAAQGWGIPMAVPLAPTVRHTMNYSNGIPSSRLTPISNVVPPRGRRGW
ncbi:MAG: hypothetical protein SFV23_12665 [Planctomycetaceae bacterium]|nr:hypothetical protein [Planctomycetaceae bacterium]